MNTWLYHFPSAQLHLGRKQKSKFHSSDEERNSHCMTNKNYKMTNKNYKMPNYFWGYVTMYCNIEINVYMKCIP